MTVGWSRSRPRGEWTPEALACQESVWYMIPMDSSKLGRSMYELMMRTSTELPEDVTCALEKAREREPVHSTAANTLDIILKSAELSRANRLPICQDTGVPFAVVRAPQAVDTAEITRALVSALKTLTIEGVLRQNCVDPVNGSNSGDNTGPHVPQVHYEPSEGPIRVDFMLKGGGSENVSTQYSLPCDELRAGRDLEGVRRCVLDAVFKAQGRGCAPGFISVCIGGDRASGYLVAKKGLFRKLGEANPDVDLARLESVITEEANMLGIGPMGLGGNTTLLGCALNAAGRHPASFFVTVSYSCWATRRYSVELDETGGVARWL